MSIMSMIIDNTLCNRTFIKHLTLSDNAIIKMLQGNMVAREGMWEYWYNILYYRASPEYWIFYMNYVIFVVYKFILFMVSVLFYKVNLYVYIITMYSLFIVICNKLKL